MTGAQRELLDSLEGKPLVVNGREYSTENLLATCNGHQLPRDPDVCKLLDIALSDDKFFTRSSVRSHLVLGG